MNDRRFPRLMLAVLRVMVDRSYRSGQNEDGSPRYSRDKNFWVNVEFWGGRVGTLRDTVRVGAAVMIAGRYHVSVWEDDAGTKRDNIVFRATDIAILPWCIESLEYKSRDGRKEPEDSGFDDGDIPF